jgi:leucyl-tRNA synthetase
MTYVVVAPEHQIIKDLGFRIKNYTEVEKYIIAAQNKTELERLEMKEKTGIELKGIKAVNPFNNEEVPIFVADYVLAHYGTGAVMAVPAHDERDFEFAKKYNLPIRQSVAPLFKGTGEDVPIESEERSERNVVFVIIKHWEKEEYLCLDWEKFGWKSFVIGGLEEGETGESTARREMEEETGYKSVKKITKIGGEIHNNFNARHKKAGNRYIKATCYFIELKDGSQSKTSEEHTKNHKFLWVKKEDVSSFINLTGHIWFWNYLLKGGCANTADGCLVNSGEFTGLSSEEARQKMTKWLEKNKLGKKKVNYKMRDWVFSRQRYWGEPIPLIFCENCKKLAENYKSKITNTKQIQNSKFKIQNLEFNIGELLNPGWIAVSENELPVKLPEVESYIPAGTGEGPLANIKKWVNTQCPKCGGSAKRETNTMPQWAGSSWYYLRYIDPKNKKTLIDKKKEKEWMPVDLYVGGAEHATRHLLYARFWHKLLYDIGVVSTKEPFKRLIHVGLINGEDGRKMSKRWGNVINPDDIIKKFGADSIRLYEMFMGPFTQNIAWSTKGVIGVRRFLEKVWRLNARIVANKSPCTPFTQRGYANSRKLNSLLHKTIKKVTEDIDNFRFNTAISSMMILVNNMEREKEISIIHYSLFIILLSPFAPHIAEELWSKLEHKKSVFKEKWPEYDKKLLKDEMIKLVIQVNGKVRDMIEAAADISEDEAKKIALESERVKRWIGDSEVKKIIFVRGRLVNIVV